jgi:hypothetical protein
LDQGINEFFSQEQEKFARRDTFRRDDARYQLSIAAGFAPRRFPWGKPLSQR